MQSGMRCQVMMCTMYSCVCCSAQDSIACAGYRGRVPGAVSLPLAQLFASNGEVKSPAEISALVRAALADSPAVLDTSDMRHSRRIVVYSAHSSDSGLAAAVLTWAGYDAVPYMGAPLAGALPPQSSLTVVAEQHPGRRQQSGCHCQHMECLLI